MSKPLESESIQPERGAKRKSSDWLRIGMVALASGVAGAAAFAWWHRKAIEGLQKAEALGKNPEFGISEDDSTEEI